jgi:hypothetical protein
VDLFKDLFDINEQSLKILPIDAEKSSALPENLLRKAIPAVVLANAANPVVYLLSDFGFILILCQNGPVRMHELTEKFE